MDWWKPVERSHGGSITIRLKVFSTQDLLLETRVNLQSPALNILKERFLAQSDAISSYPGWASLFKSLVRLGQLAKTISSVSGKAHPFCVQHR
jgi:hypothetical protein